MTERLDYADPTRINGKRTEIPVSTNYLKYRQIWEDRPIKREYSVSQFSSNYPSQGLNTGSNPVGDTSKARNAALLWAIQRFKSPGSCNTFHRATTVEAFMCTIFCTAPLNLWTGCRILLSINSPENPAVFVTSLLRGQPGVLAHSSGERSSVVFSGDGS